MPMSGRILRLSPIAATLLLAACGGGTTTVTQVVTTTVPPPSPAAPLALRVYFLRDGKVVPVARHVPATQAVAAAALAALAAGPRAAEGLETAVPVDFHPSITIAGGVATLTGGPKLDVEGRAQVVYTLTQFPTVHAVELEGARLTRAALEDETPLILAETPLPG